MDQSIKVESFLTPLKRYSIKHIVANIGVRCAYYDPKQVNLFQ